MNPMVEYSESGGPWGILILVVIGHIVVGLWALGACALRAIRASVERSREKPIDEAEIEAIMNASDYVPEEIRREESLRRLTRAISEPREIPDDLRDLLGPAKGKR